IGRPATMHGVKIDKEMGVNTWAAFAGDDKNAVVDGDFAVTEDELQPVLKSLLKDKINIVAIPQHMTHEEPRIMFFHYWGRGSARWRVGKGESAPGKPDVLKQSGQATVAVCFKNDTNLKDGVGEVKFKPVAGKEGQAGGIIWRAQDAKNYYISRANALEDNV